MTPQTAREFFEGLSARVDPERAGRLGASYRFEIEDAGRWRLEADDDRLVVTESSAPADCVISTDERTFLRVVRGEQSPMGAYMRGKIKVEGDLGLALRLRDVFG